ncbi:MAG: hypothetical protein M1423_06575, partial [Acidobacteria bacterium]|nr:hypothetical protein [Acidobacteriota bacterium]
MCEKESSQLHTVTDAGRQTALQLDMDVLVGYILQTGVLLSLTLITAGLLWAWFRTGRLGVNYPITGVNLFQFVVGEARLAAQGTIRPRL